MADCANDFAVLEDLLGEALALHQEGQFAEAEGCYREVLAACGDHAEVHYYLGLLCQADGRGDEAVHHLEMARTLEPQQAMAHFALGNLWHGQGEHTLAAAAYREVVRLAPDNGQAWYNLGVVLFSAGQIADAISSYEEAIRYISADADLCYNLAIAYGKAGDYEHAVAAYGQAITLAPSDLEIRYNLALMEKRAGNHEVACSHLEQVVALDAGYAPAYGHLASLYARRGEPERAMRCYERLIELDHDVEAARHMLGALCGETISSAAPGYVRKLFDGYAETFEEELVERLGYTAPNRLRQMVGELLPAGQSLGRLLDLGCGTGLVGEAFRDLAGTLIGVDLSSRMVALARAKGIYDELAVGEVADFCRVQETQCDGIVAADVVVYLGELEDFFRAVAGTLVPGGFFALSTERCDKDFILRPTGRYAHATNYVTQQALACGLRVVRQEETQLRQEKGEWLIGDLFVFAAAG